MRDELHRIPAQMVLLITAENEQTQKKAHTNNLIPSSVLLWKHSDCIVYDCWFMWDIHRIYYLQSPLWFRIEEVPCDTRCTCDRKPTAVHASSHALNCIHTLAYDEPSCVLCRNHWTNANGSMHQIRRGYRHWKFGGFFFAFNENDISDEHKIKTGMDNISESFYMQKMRFFILANTAKSGITFSIGNFKEFYIFWIIWKKKNLYLFWSHGLRVYAFVYRVCLYHWHGNSMEMVWNWVPYLAL